MSQIQHGPKPFEMSAARLRSLLTAATIFLAIVLIAERLGYAAVYRGQSSARELGIQLLLGLPATLNLLALWFLRGAVASAASGEPFGGVVILAFRRVGALLAASAFAAIIVIPFVARLLGQAVPRLIDADLATLVLAALGLGMMFVGVLIERAGAAQRELEEFF